MGDPKRQRKKYDSPRHPWRMDQLEVELNLIGEYGLRNKKELWHYKTILSRIRGIVRSLLGKSIDERTQLQNMYLSKIEKLGLLSEGAEIDDVLDLEIKDLLARRLQTLIFRRGLSKSIHHARQMITHGHIKIGNRRITVPSYFVKKDEENLIQISEDSPYATQKEGNIKK